MRWLLLLCFAACSRDPVAQPPADLAVPVEDFAGVDLRGADLARPGDLAGADLAAACASCEVGQRCVAGSCQYVDQMQVRLGQLANQIIDGGTTSPTFVYQNMACFYHPLVDQPVSETVLGSDGPCRAIRVIFVQDAGISTNPNFSGSAGLVTISGGTQGTYTMAPSDGGAGCYMSSLADPPSLFSDGQQITVSTAGGSDFPAFTKTLTAPPLLSFTTGLIQRGQPLTVNWTGSAPGETLRIFATVYDTVSSTSISCDVDDIGSYTIPASLTAHFPNGAATGNLYAQRERIAREDPASKVVTMTVFLWSTATRTVRYQP
jgi:hypothetical protein